MRPYNYICETCNKTFIRQSYPSKEKLSKHKYCSNRCAGLAVGGDFRKAVSRRIDSNGYVMIKIPNNPMARINSWVPEHRLIMSQIIGRPLIRKEEVHHINGNKQDNRPENLMLLPKPEHTKNDKCRGCTIRNELAGINNLNNITI